jgi:hypothetical protein
MKKYPYKKVIFLFTLAPMIGGFLFGLWGIVNDYINNAELKFHYLFLYPILAEVFGIHAFVLAGIYAWLKFKRVLSSFFKISLIIFVSFLFYGVNFKRENFLDFLEVYLLSCTLAVVSSWIMAWFALPKPEDLEDE